LPNNETMVVYNARKRYNFKHPTYKLKPKSTMRQCIILYNQKFNQCANGYSYNQHANSYENTNIGIILKTYK
jgi:hypothetical protein